MDPVKVIADLKKSELFSAWLKENRKCYLSHFFVQLDDKLKAITNWDIGYYNPITKKIIIFSLDEASKSFSIKPADDVFKKESDIVERLEVSVVKLSLEEAKDRCCEELPKQFPKESYGGGFLILQNWKKTVVWNFTLMTKTIKFANLKINALDGEVFEHQIIELIQK